MKKKESIKGRKDGGVAKPKMCGICGFNWEDKKLINRMCKVISYRGPDQKGIYTDKDISLGHLRLSIIDLSEKGKQPMQNEDDSIQIVYNGEIYNYLELRGDLEKKGHIFRSHTDTEVLIHAYEEYGVDCLNRLNGMFAFAIWDSNKKEIFIARDRFGIKPLFYYFDDDKFIFASEIKSILEHNIQRTINVEAIKQLIIFAYTIDGQTLFRGINELLPGHYIIYSNKKLKCGRYWKLAMGKILEGDFCLKKVRRLLEDSVKKRMMSDVPLGATLSGGIDSSTIVALMSENSKNVKTFTLGINDAPSNEFDNARIIAEHCNTEHHEVKIDYEQITKEIPKILWHMEFPYGRPAVILTYFTSKEIKKWITVSLIGDGADEIFGGYNRYFNSDKIDKHKDINYLLSGYFNNDGERDNIFKNLDLKSFKEKNLKGIFNLYFNLKDRKLDEILLMDIEQEIPGIQLSRVDKMSMASSVEMRVPFMDHNLVEFGMRIPAKLKINKGIKKIILQKAIKDLLPKEIIERVKLPFGFPLELYFKNGFMEIVDCVLDKEKIKYREFLNKENIAKLIDKAKKNRSLEDNFYRQLLFLTNLEIWYRLFIEERRDNPNLDMNYYL